MLDVTLSVTITLSGPVLTKSTSAGRFGIDAAFAKDENGNFSIPRGLIKGRLRQSIAELGDLGIELPKLEGMLGRPAQGAHPTRGEIDFTAFAIADSRTRSAEKYRIRIDHDRGAADDGAHQVIESIAAAGEPVSFSGELSFYAEDRAEADALSLEIRQAFAFTTSIGANRSIGFGEIVGLRVEYAEDPRPMTSGPDLDVPEPSPSVIWIALDPKSPFCLARPGPRGNIFESDKIISGGGVKGCVASTWLAFWRRSGEISAGLTHPEGLTPYPNLAANFDKIRFTHAFPSKEMFRPVAVPYSVVSAKENGQIKFYDVFDKKEAQLINGNAPEFQPDWKERISHLANAAFGWDPLKSVFEVRNQHDRERRKAADEELFSYEMVNPSGYKWYASIDFNAIEDVASQRAAIAEFRHLMDSVKELRFLGKTKSRVGFTILDEPCVSKIGTADPHNGEYVLVLQTPALLCSPDDLTESNGETGLRAAYEKIWNEISGGTLRLVNYFAGQHLAGGDYIRGRFQKNRAYNPFLLTDAGSVFVLSDTGKQNDVKVFAAAVIADWAAHGLPVPGWVKERHGGDTWKETPYVRENGFGEITVNLASHFEMRVRDGGNNG